MYGIQHRLQEFWPASGIEIGEEAAQDGLAEGAGAASD